MNNSIIMTIIGIMVLTTATIGYGATLATPLEFNLIGASDNTAVGAARANVTSIDFIQEVGSNGVIVINGTNFSPFKSCNSPIAPLIDSGVAFTSFINNAESSTACCC